MSLLKYLMLFMIALVIVVVVVVGYFFFTAKVTVADCEITGNTASSQTELFSQVQQQVSLDALQGTMFSQEEIGDAEDYAFITYTIELSNQCLVAIDMVEIQIEPEDGDVLQIGYYDSIEIAPKSQGTVTATILTAKDNHSVRDVIITYYVWGVSFSIEYTCG